MSPSCQDPCYRLLQNDPRLLALNQGYLYIHFSDRSRLYTDLNLRNRVGLSLL